MKSFRVYKLIFLLLVTPLFWAGCHATYYKVPITKSRKHFRPYDAKKDRGKKRVKIKRYKSLKRTKGINEN